MSENTSAAGRAAPAVAALPALDDAAPERVCAAVGARARSDVYGPQADPPATAEPSATDAPTEAVLAAGFVTLLSDLGVIGVHGADARTFLHNQLTNDVEHLGAGEARWYGYCSPKGRLLATAPGWADEDGVLLVVPRLQSEALRKRLAMFVLRAKAKVTNRSDTHVLLGVGGAAAAGALQALGLALPAPMRVERGAERSPAGGLAAIGMPTVEAAGQPCARALLCVPAESLAAVWSALHGPLTPVPTPAWRWTEVRSGIPRLAAGAVEQFVPQMINFEVVEGVNFKKGCYPGQEIVARSQYLGKLKRRMFAAHLDGPEPAPGSDVLGADGQPCGQVVLAAPAPRGGVDLLVESQVAAVQAGGLTAGGVALEMGSLPYALPA
ncbi:MAG TPA: folate-binding protein [Quisquiliibacterium sp.]|nr:MAG: folate-binding protein [Burkholderiaceae bacterium]HPA88859.1 folate-binding protein [Quisquiliibacterium sp.]HQN11580.1 folate-binding protein [Quisquiliibacterium sp.]HQP65799.1 folate-binding protein [Quisquiliibacterium sp.]